MRPFALAALLLAPALCVHPAHAQELSGITGLSTPTPAHRHHVTFAAEPIDIPANHPSTVELRFRVDPGFHVNSNKPSSELLIPTVLTLATPENLKLLETRYPSGTPFHLAIGAGETLDVYQGDFRVTLRVVAPKGDSTLDGTLRYQACDNAACFPPRTLSIHVPITAR